MTIRGAGLYGRNLEALGSLVDGEALTELCDQAMAAREAEQRVKAQDPAEPGEPDEDEDWELPRERRLPGTQQEHISRVRGDREPG